MKRIIALVGDYWHKPELASTSLQLALRTWAGESDVSLKFIEAGRLQEALSEKPDAFVMFKEDLVAPMEDRNARWLSADAEDAIVHYVANGGGWLAWHSGLASYDPEGRYVEMLRGRFVHHPEHQVVRYLPEGDGFGAPEAFEFLDEHYFVECDAERTDVFLRSESVGGKSVAGWRHDYGQGRVCCLTPAHLAEGLNDPAFLRLLGQAVQWCAGA